MRDGTLARVERGEAIEELSELFTFLADNDFAGYSPIYERLARRIATDDELLEFIAQAADPNARRGRLPVLFLAATHDRVLAEPESELAAIYRGDIDHDPVPAFLDLLARERAAIADSLRNRSVQTNEVGRSAVLAPAFGRALDDVTGPVTLFEIGPSAGLNLFVDRFQIELVRDGIPVAVLGPSGTTVHLRCELRGPLDPPAPRSNAAPVGRAGLDPHPIDVRSDAECRWLRACLWPGVAERPERLRAALDIARTEPPELLTGDAAVDLGPALASQPRDAHLVVFATWALAYLSADGRRSTLDAIDHLGAQRDLDLVTFEEPRFTPWLESYDPTIHDRYRGDGTPTLLGLRSWRGGVVTTTALAIAHPHGRWIHWMEDANG